MKKLIALLLLCALVLSGCAQNGPAATQAPTETMAPTTEAPTEIPTEAPTEPLTEEELAQLKYEQLFSNAEYVMDWNSVHMDVGMNLQTGGDYCLEIFHLENGFIWEALRPLEMDPCNYEEDRGIVDVYFQFDEENAYFYSKVWNYNELTPSGNFPLRDRLGAVDMTSEHKETVMTKEWNLAQSIFAELMAKQYRVMYLGNEEGLDMFILNPYGTEQLFFYIEPETNEVQKLYMKTLEKTYYVEFVQELPEYIANPTVPTRYATSMTFEQVSNHCDEIVEYLAVHRCNTKKATAPSWRYPDRFTWVPYCSAGISLPSIEAVETEEEIAAKQAKWVKILANKTYILDAPSWAFTRKGSPVGDDMYRAVRVTDEQGVKFEHYAVREPKYHSQYYRADGNTAYFQTVSPNMGNHWYSVDVSSDYVKNDVDEICPPVWYLLECATSQEYAVTPLKYAKSVNGLDVLTNRYVVGYSDVTIELYVNPETYEIKYVYKYDNTDYGCLKDMIELIYEDDLYICVNYPTETENTITYADMAEYQESITKEAWGAAGGGH